LFEKIESTIETECSPDPLPAVLALAWNARKSARSTKVTEVRNETTDDE
jgi:hypothetical protein